MRRTALIAALLGVVALAAPGPARAAQKAPSLGPVPVQTDCLGFHDTERGCYYDIRWIEYTVSPHIVHVGDTFTGNATWEGAFSWGFSGSPPGSSIIECTGNGTPSGTCTYEAVAPTGGWSPSPAENNGQTADSGWGAALYCCTIGAYVDGDYIAILGGDEYAIDGFVRDPTGEPVEGATIWIKGTNKDGESVDLYTETDDTGYYNAIVKKGDYQVSGTFGSHSLCLASVKSQCVETKTGAHPDATVDFRRNGYAEIAGTVTDEKGRPLPNIEVFAAKGGKAVADKLTKGDGTYRIDLEEAGKYDVYALDSEKEFEPQQRTVTASIDEQVTADFQEIEDPLEVTIESGYVTATGKEFVVPLFVKNKSKSTTVTDIKGVNAYGYQFAVNAFPPSETGQVRGLATVAHNVATSLGPGQSSYAQLRMESVAPGLVGMRAAFTGKVEEEGRAPREVKAHRDAKILIESKQSREEEKARLAAQGIELALAKAGQMLRNARSKEALKVAHAMEKHLGPAARKRWLGSKKGLHITPYERELARFSGLTPEQVAIGVPNESFRFKGRKLDVQDVGSAYNEASMKAQDREVFDYLKSRFGKPAAKLWNAGVSEAQYLSLLGSSEGQSQIAADLATKWHGFAQSAEIDKNAMIAAIFASGPEVQQAAGESRAAVAKFTRKVNNQIGKVVEHTYAHQGDFNQELISASKQGNYKKVQSLLAQRDSKVVATVGAFMGDDLIGRAAGHVGGALLNKAGSGMVEVADRLGLKGAKPTAAFARALEFGEEAKAGLPSYAADLPDEAKFAIGMDRLRQLGGISGKDAKITQQIVAETNQALADAGYQGEVRFVARPVNPNEVVGGLAKVEVVGVKSVNPIDELLGASAKAHGQPAVFRPREPTSLPNWDSYTASDKLAVKQRYELRMGEYLEYTGDAPAGWKMKGMKEATKGRVDLSVEGKYPGQKRTYSMQLDTQHVEGTTVFRYKHLSVDGDVIFDSKTKSAAIGTDVDGLIAVDRATGKVLPPKYEDLAFRKFQELGAEAAKTEGYSNPFHGWTLRRLDASDLSVEKFPEFASYGLRHLPEEQARPIAQRIADEFNAEFPDRTPLTADDILKKVSGFDQPAISITATEVAFGRTGVVFVDP